jgi:very-short-patch-repair endonuclease
MKGGEIGRLGDFLSGVRKELDPNRPDARIRRIAERQYGVISSGQLLSAGLSPAGVSRRIAAGVLHRLHRGVYAVGHRSLGNEGRWMAAVLACGDGAVLSHGSAAALWQIVPRRETALVEVSVPTRTGRAKRNGIRLHRPVALPSSDCTRRTGIPVTTPTRTLADLRPLLSPARFSSAVREAEFRRLPVGNQERDDDARSELETRMLALCRHHRLPKPAVNAAIDQYEVDFLWANQSLIVEVDGWESHRTRSAFEEDRARDARLAVLGYETVRFTWRQVTDNARGVAKTIRSLLRARGNR